MRWSRHSLCFVFLAAWAGSLSGAQNRARSDQQELIELEQTWNRAFYRKDVPTIDDILAEEFIATYDNGRRGDKAGELALVVDFNQRVESAVQDEFIVKIYGNTAVVWFTLNLVGISEGERVEMAFRFTDVFVRRDDRWQCVSSQATKMNTEP